MWVLASDLHPHPKVGGWGSGCGGGWGGGWRLVQEWKAGWVGWGTGMGRGVGWIVLAHPCAGLAYVVPTVAHIVVIVAPTPPPPQTLGGHEDMSLFDGNGIASGDPLPP